MNFRITGLDAGHFRPFYGMSDAQLATRGVRRIVVDAPSGYPDRIELRDMAPGESALLMNHVHQPADTPFRASHAIFVREGAEQAFDAVNAVPPLLRSRMLSVRAFGADHMMRDADVVDGAALEPLIARLLGDPGAAYLQVHFARRGCYAARVERA